ncbi:hypothetical protein [Desulfosporosinus sp. OT]|uniref:hypothetical protein n=1 Tax=Desulfosporosinus sp. OT TaxID=913865 RepID=UPI001112C3F4|nr:hypothetical protein [Desulfosporosinus sp. OT]
MSAGDKALRNATGLVHDSNRTFEVRAPPWMARCRDGLMPRCPKTLSSLVLAFLQDGKERRTCRKPRGFAF